MKNQINHSRRLLRLILAGVGLISLLILLTSGTGASPPDEGGSLHLAGVTTTGGLWHTIRRADGHWMPFGDVKAQAGNRGSVVDADIQVIGSPPDYALHLCAVTDDGKLWHTIRRADGRWTPFGDVKGQAGARGKFVSVGISSVREDLHVLGATSDGKIWHTIRKADGTWQPFGDVKAQAGDRGIFLRVGIANSDRELHVTGVTSDGKLWHTIRKADGTWLPFRDVKGQAGNRGGFLDVDSVVMGLQMHLSGVTDDGKLWHTIRNADGTWTPFGDIKGEAGNPGNFLRVSAGQISTLGEVHISGLTSDGRLWHTIRKADGRWTPFGDVKGQAGNPGTFKTVAIDGLENLIR